MRNISLEISYPRCNGKASPRPILLKSKLSMSLDQQPENLHSLFLLNVQVEVYQITLKLWCWPLAFTLYKAFLKRKRGLKLISLSRFLYDFWRKLFFMIYAINWANFSVWLPSLLQILDISQYVYCNYLFSSLKKFKNFKNFEVTHSPFSSFRPKSESSEMIISKILSTLQL